ncbi:uncharacterized protein SCHCODRAFT_02683520 [Schizophyllum commune H4-8]|uniref:uncharacterized protein n=1 Tax=Schizophyllum commune (strain H4-8 / FGSC 9210) TaxID=578458 RepID=UPI00215EB2F8|nr:uncharacterized protein SCHCODRAFT_02683520 [Schizophyllum commune H4-8]KAI5900691.1 hypothetical protein SCHCODRAFT_02683520 [Schizophyllum commune H4-8]
MTNESPPDRTPERVGTQSTSVPQGEETSSPGAARRTVFGIRQKPRQRPATSYDYEEKYGEDAYGEELGPNARFWHVSLDEGRVYDADMVEGWRDTLDVLLVFAGLFSSVVTTFVVQSSQALQTDYAQISVTLLSEMIAIQRAWAEGSPVKDVARSHISLSAVSASKLDYWCNGLWYMSLSLSLSVALMTVLVKQWLQVYQGHVSGTPKHQALIRQFRLIGVERWNVPLIVGLLPMLLHASLLLFFVGLSLYTFSLDTTIAYVVIALAGSAYSLYIVANVLPMFDPQCPYKTPLSNYGSHLLWGALTGVHGWVRRLEQDILPGPGATGAPPNLESASCVRRYMTFARTRALSRLKKLARLLPLSTQWTPRTREAIAAARDETSLMIDCLSWVHATTSDPSAVNITVQAVSGLPSSVADEPISHGGMLDEILSRLEILAESRIAEDEQYSVRERLARSLLFFAIPDDARTRRRIGEAVFCLDAAVVLHGMGRDTAELQGAVLALAASDCFDGCLSLLATDTIDRLPFLYASPPSSLRLRPIVWKRALQLFAQGAEISPTNAVHLALFLWRRAEGNCSTKLSRLLSDDDLVQAMSDARGRGEGLDALRASYALLCGHKCSELDLAQDPILHEGLLPHLLRVAFERLANAAEEFNQQRIARSERQFYVDLHHDELQFLSSIAKAALSDEQAWDLFGTITRLVKLPLWRLEARADLLDVYQRQESTPSWAARPLLQNLVQLLSSPPSADRAHVRGVKSALRQIATIFERCPDEALDDILLALRPYSRLDVQEDNKSPAYVDATEILADILSAYFVGIFNACGDDDERTIDVRAHLDYLTRCDDYGNGQNRLTGCLGIDLLVVASSDGEEVHQLHQACLRLAEQTSESYAVGWTGALAAIALQGELATTPLGRALRSVHGTRAYRDLLNATSSSVVVAGLQSPMENDIVKLASLADTQPDRIVDESEGMSVDKQHEEEGEDDERTLCQEFHDDDDSERDA